MSASPARRAAIPDLARRRPPPRAPCCHPGARSPVPAAPRRVRRGRSRTNRAGTWIGDAHCAARRSRAGPGAPRCTHPSPDPASRPRTRPPGSATRTAPGHRYASRSSGPLRASGARCRDCPPPTTLRGCCGAHLAAPVRARRRERDRRVQERDRLASAPHRVEGRSLVVERFATRSSRSSGSAMASARSATAIARRAPTCACTRVTGSRGCPRGPTSSRWIRPREAAARGPPWPGRPLRVDQEPAEAAWPGRLGLVVERSIPVDRLLGEAMASRLAAVAERRHGRGAGTVRDGGGEPRAGRDTRSPGHARPTSAARSAAAGSASPRLSRDGIGLRPGSDAS